MSPKVDPKVAQRFQGDQGPLIVSRVNVILLLGMALVPMFGLIDYYLHPEFFLRFVSYRLAASLTCLGLFIVNHKWDLGPKSFYLGVAAFYAVGLSIILMIVDLGGYATSYYAGLNLVFVGFVVIIPVAAGQILLYCLVLYLAYLSLVFFFSQPQSLALFVSNNMFVLSTLTIVVTGSYISHKLRLREYLLRLELEEAQEKLRQYSQKLEIKVEEKDRDLMQTMDELRNGRELLADTQRASIYGLASVAESRDKETGQHLERIQVYCALIASELSSFKGHRGVIDDRFIADITDSCVLHDLGKVAIPDDILLKPGKLTPKEYEIIKTHTAIGGDLLGAIDKRLGENSYIRLGREIAYFHHERVDGSGYPLNLKGKNIPLSARIVAVADVYDALTSNRCYRLAMSHQEAVKLIINGRGSQFDEDVVDAFIRVRDRLREVGRRIHQSDEPPGLNFSL
ncbi:MAG: HD domain-containing protein [Deltaproteobacteria bacterium]|nr:HD domain-containing protein [Deltaproteobacteria bacterium]